MKKWAVKVGFMGVGGYRMLYTKDYIVKAKSAEVADVAVYNGLSMQEFHNFRILRIKEIEDEH